MKIKKLLKIIGVLVCIILASLMIKTNDFNPKQDLQSTKTSGAGKSLDNWSFERTYPFEEIPQSKYLTAFEEKTAILQQRTTLQSGQWESLGPENIGGRMLCLGFHPTNPDIIFAGSASGGLWKTTTQGVGRFAWEQVSTGFPVLGVASIAIDQNNPNIMLIGTGEVYGTLLAEPGTVNRFTRGTYGIGILKSTNGGSTWSQVLSFNENQLKGVQDIEINPQNSMEIYAATTDGVYSSTDGGDNWTLIFNQPNCIDIEIDSNNGSIVYVTQGNFNINLNPALSGIFKSTNSGGSFTEITDQAQFPAWSGNAKIAIDPTNSNTLYASIQVFSIQNPTTPRGVYKSINGGQNWTYINNQNISNIQGWYSHDIAINPANPLEVINVGVDAWKSTDGGNSFTKKSDWTSRDFTIISVDTPEGEGIDNYIHGDIHAVYYHPLVSNKVFYASDGGVFSSLDGGETFTTHNGGLQTTQFYANMGSSSTDPNFCIGGAQDNSTYIYRGNPSWSLEIGGDGMSAAVNQDNDQIIFGSFQFIAGMVRSTTSINPVNWVSIFPLPTLVSGDFSAFNAPYELAPSNQNIMYAGAQYLYKSVNGGTNWNPTSAQSVDGTNNILKIAISPTNPDVIYLGVVPSNPFAGPTGAKIIKSTDGGQNFTVVANGLPNRVVKDIEFDPSNENILYATFSGFGSNHVFKTTNAGANWVAIDNGLPDLPTNTILIDPQNSTDIYVGNDLGVYYSENGGDSWEVFSEALPEATMVYDLNNSPSNRKVRIATHGHGIWQRNYVKDALSLPEVQISESNFNLYPNPTSGVVNISIETNQAFNAVTVEIYSMLGQKIATIHEGELQSGLNKFSWNTSGSISSGTYFVKLFTNGNVVSKKLLVQ